MPRVRLRHRRRFLKVEVWNPESLPVPVRVEIAHFRYTSVVWAVGYHF